jgi:predicted acetylornithine/succinylornithine family transaminase
LTNSEIIALTDKYVVGTYKRFPIAITRGSGSRLFDADGKSYLDFVAGLAVTNLGHCHPKVVRALCAQAGELFHVSNLYHIGPQAKLAELLCENSFADKVFFANSGSEAIEAAIKLARRYYSSKGDLRSSIISMERSFHGRTFAALAATAQKKIQEGFEPLLQDFTYVPFGDVSAVRDALGPNTAAVLLEPVQGEGGVNIAPASFLKDLKALLKEAGVLLIFDEVQVGMGRTGKLFAYEHFGVTPDIMTLAKGLSNGMPIGAMLATDEVAGAFTPGTHASTFGGNPLSTAAGVATLGAMLDDGVLSNCVKVGAYLKEKLNALKGRYGFIKEIRAMGLIAGMEIDMPGASIVESALGKGLLINCTADTVLRFLPPLIISVEEVDEMISILSLVFDEVESAK